MDSSVCELKFLVSGSVNRVGCASWILISFFLDSKSVSSSAALFTIGSGTPAIFAT